MSTQSEKKQTITVSTLDDETFDIEMAVALESQMMRYLIEDNCADNVIPLPNVHSKTLRKVIEYCSKHVEEKSKNEKDQHKDALKKWDDNYIDVDEKELYNLTLAANYLNIEGLLDLTLQNIADRIKGKKPEEIRETFNIKNDLPPEIEEEVRSENQWAF